MKKVIIAWLNALSKSFLGYLAKAYGRKVFLEKVLAAGEGGTDFVTYHCRPKLAVSVGTQSDRLEASKSLAIVIQGPIAIKNNFTLETVKIYQRHFAGSAIILSTWENETPSVVRQFEDLGITVIRNCMPPYAGQSNINLQIVTSQSGIRKAKEMGVEYALKTRTDQRIFAPNVADFLYHITEVFPVKGDWPRQKKRIVGCSLNTFKYRMYGLSDMLIYGHIEDMLMFWNVDLDSRVFTKEEQLQINLSLRSFARGRVCEVYLATEYLSKVGRNQDWTLRDSWAAFADHFCVIDKEQLDLFWPKYDHNEYRWLKYDKDVRMQELCFREWLGLYTNSAARDIPEIILDDQS